MQISTRHRASTSMYSLTFRVRATTPPQYGRNGTASLQVRRFYRWRGESMYSLTLRVRATTRPQYGRNGTASLQVRRFYRWRGESAPAHACGGPDGLPLGSATHF